MTPQHGWDQLVKLSGDAGRDCQAIQPYLEHVMSTTGTQIDTSPLGPVIEYVATINGQEVVVRVIQLANNALQISDA
jgi:hypothetical protein